MRFIHTADWHLGRLFHGVHLTDDQRYALMQFVELVRDTKPDAVLVAGDIYDRAVPPPEAVDLLDEVLCKLVLEIKVPVVLIAGNHDSPNRLSFASRLFRDNRLYVSGALGRETRAVTFSDRWGKVQVYPVPYAEPATVRQALGDGCDGVVCHDSAMREICGRIHSSHALADRSILVGHAFVAGGSECESERPLSVGGAGTVSVSALAGFGYVALGHLHGAQVMSNVKGQMSKVGEERSVGDGEALDSSLPSSPLRASVPSGLRVSNEIRYSGSLLKYSFDEAHHLKGVHVVEMDGQGKCAVETVRLTPRRDVRRISGTMVELLGAEGAEGSREDYLEVMVTDEGPVLDPVGRLRQVYPNVMSIQRPRREGGGVAADRVDVRGKTAVELFGAFFKHVNGEEMTQEQGAALVSVVEEIALKEREVVVNGKG